MTRDTAAALITDEQAATIQSVQRTNPDTEVYVLVEKPGTTTPEHGPVVILGVIFEESAHPSLTKAWINPDGTVLRTANYVHVQLTGDGGLPAAEETEGGENDGA